jgi:glyoxylase-like metal-dependent hydrolase (beta-lactamase superfamily II)
MLVGAGGNVTASVGLDGIFLVDSGLEETSEALLAAVARLERRLAFNGVPAKPIRYVVNTSMRPEHTGGNAALTAARPGETDVIAQANTLIRLVNREAPFEMLPTETFADGNYNLGGTFNGESIRFIHVPAATTDGDVIVYFRGADVISTGDVFSVDEFPQIDVGSGGSIGGVIDALNTILSIAIPDSRSEGGTLIVPGHGRLADSADVGAYRDMLTIIRDQVQYLIDSGMTLNQVQAARPTLGYDRRFGSQDGAGHTEAFVEAVYRSLLVAPR